MAPSALDMAPQPKFQPTWLRATVGRLAARRHPGRRQAGDGLARARR